jgi:hypothetical protein
VEGSWCLAKSCRCSLLRQADAAVGDHQRARLLILQRGAENQVRRSGAIVLELEPARQY